MFGPVPVARLLQYTIMPRNSLGCQSDVNVTR